MPPDEDFERGLVPVADEALQQPGVRQPAGVLEVNGPAQAAKDGVELRAAHGPGSPTEGSILLEGEHRQALSLSWTVPPRLSG